MVGVEGPESDRIEKEEVLGIAAATAGSSMASWEWEAAE